MYVLVGDYGVMLYNTTIVVTILYIVNPIRTGGMESTHIPYGVFPFTQNTFRRLLLDNFSCGYPYEENNLEILLYPPSGALF